MTLFVPPNVPALDTNGNPLSGALWYFYLTGTTTPVDVYTSATLATAHANPVVADSAGRFPPIYRSPDVTYRGVLKTATGTTIADYDPVAASGELQDSALLVGRAFSSSYTATDTPIGVANGLVYIESERNSTVDLLYLRTRHLSGSACYSLHIVDFAEEGMAGGGSIGAALDGPGVGPVGTFNRRGAGQGDGIIASRLESGNGFAVKGNFAGTGTGGAVSALKQNTTGVAGGPSGTGPALEAINQSEQGAAIEATTTANNASTISNIFNRHNISQGVIADFRALVGGARTGALVGLRALITPSATSTGTASVTGLDLAIGPNISGCSENYGMIIVNNSSSSANAWGAIIQSVGANTTNRALRLQASGATNNIALEVIAGATSIEGSLNVTLPVHADNAAASAALFPNTFYRTATGEVRTVV